MRRISPVRPTLRPLSAPLLALSIVWPLAASAEPTKFERNDIFTAPVAKGERGGATLTSLIPPGLDPERVAAIVDRRVDALTERVVTDLLTEAGGWLATAPTVDLVSAITGLLRPGADPEASAQEITSAIARAGLSAALAHWVATGESEAVKSCPSTIDQWEAAYEGLATSAGVWALGFEETDGKAEKSCHAFAVLVAQVADALVLGAWPGVVEKGSGTRLSAAFTKLGAKVPDAFTDCGGAMPETIAQAKCVLNRLNNPTSDYYSAASDTTWEASEAIAAVLPYRLLIDRLRPEVTFARLVKTLDDLGTALGTDDRVRQARVAGMLARFIGTGASSDPDRRLTRGDVIILVDLARDLLDDVVKARKKSSADANDDIPEVALDLIKEVLAALPQAVVEDSDALLGLRLDSRRLGRSLVASYQDQTRDGFYLRATVGTGYLSVPDGPTWAPLVYEQIGVGWRAELARGRVRLGPHIAVSGLLHRFVLEEVARDATLLMVGVAANLYDAIDVTVDGGVIVGAKDDDLNGRAALTVGVQVPLIEYLTDDDDD